MRSTVPHRFGIITKEVEHNGAGARGIDQRGAEAGVGGVGAEGVGALVSRVGGEAAEESVQLAEGDGAVVADDAGAEGGGAIGVTCLDAGVRLAEARG